MFVVTKVLSRQAYFCRDKRCVCRDKRCDCRDKHVFVATKMTLVAAPASDRKRRVGSDERGGLLKADIAGK